MSNSHNIGKVEIAHTYIENKNEPKGKKVSEKKKTTDKNKKRINIRFVSFI